ncbi:MAG TPA: hypothetical protein ENN30_00335 [Candidatus Woesearchaeota archaeon]|nr:hypothetical protein [Candidatus Woesearchaeota archaeon]
MKIFAVSDLHGDSNIKIPEETDLILVAGDLAPYQPGEDKDAIKKTKDVLKALKSTKLPVVLISGNIDFPEEIEKFCENTNIAYFAKGSFEYDNVAVICFSYGVSSIELDESAKRLFAKHKNKTTILLTHVPPFNTKTDLAFNGSHIGKNEYNELIEEYSPTIHICGHVHEARGKDVYKGAIILNCGPKGAIIDMNNNKLKVELIK